MVKKLLLFLRTIKYLKFRQIFYQIFYRLKPVKSLTHYKKLQVPFFLLNFSLPDNSANCYKENNNFIFLNQLHQFQNEIDWSFNGYGKLWNYNLQYFDYLKQDNIPNSTKEGWLSDIGRWLEDGRLTLEPYPVSIRIINTIKFLSANKINSLPIRQNVFAQLRYLNTHLEYHISGNHLLENAFALFMGGHAFQNAKWKQKAKKLLYRELKEQVNNDGGHIELSPMYHQLILFRLLELTDWYRKVEAPDNAFLSFVKERAIWMLTWLQNVTFKNGDIPYLNDSGANIAFTSQTLFHFAGLLNLKTIGTLPLKESGYRKYNFGNYECVVDIADITPAYQPGHTHADIFSFILHFHRSPFIVDVGISTYEKGERRNYERSTKAHNTVELENENQFEVWDVFRVGRRANIHITKETDSALVVFHDGYKRHFDAIHKRSFFFSSQSVKIIDVVETSTAISAKTYLHFHPTCNVEAKNGNVMINNATTISFVNARRTNLESYQYPLGYNLYTDAKVLVVEFHKSLDTLITFA